MREIQCKCVKCGNSSPPHCYVDGMDGVEPLCVACLFDEFFSVRNKLAAATAKIAELEYKYGFTYCAYCGESFEIDKPANVEAISQHIATCAKHPMRAVEAELVAKDAKIEALSRLGMEVARKLCDAELRIEEFENEAMEDCDMVSRNKDE